MPKMSILRARGLLGPQIILCMQPEFSWYQVWRVLVSQLCGFEYLQVSVSIETGSLWLTRVDLYMFPVAFRLSSMTLIKSVLQPCFICEQTEGTPSQQLLQEPHWN